MIALTKLRVRDWAEADRPREKLLLKGVQTLSDAELLAILIGSGSREETVVELAQRICRFVDNDLNRLGKLSVKQLMHNFKGIGEAKAVSIVAALELGKRREKTGTVDPGSILCSRDIFLLFHPILCDLLYEEFWALFLNHANKIVGKVKVSQGGVSQTVVDGKLIYREAIHCLASKIILCHNHPSGNPKPSRADDLVTEQIQQGAELLNMMLVDHVIIAQGAYYSYADDDKIKIAL
ncbi:MAG: DNA repair protein RadC [Dysgonamonadaceae bacterium]|jgi:DNA repair protein RadC|nr:DNA repair protein RadC [Dysgonamonadaceae bacterium]